jgi:drug/metabolite transporter (DMT)-like permease
LGHSNFPLLGIVLAIANFTIWVIIDAMMKIMAQAGLPSYEIIGAMNAIAAIILILGSLLKTRSIRAAKQLWPEHVWTLLLLALLVLAGNYSCVIALKHLPLTVFYASVFTAPMMIAILAAAFLRETLGWIKFLAIVVGFMGVLIAVIPSRADALRGDAIGYSAAFGSAAAFAVSIVLTRSLTKSEHPASVVFFNALAQAIAGIVLTPCLGSGPPLSRYLLALLFAAGIFSVVANLAGTLAVKYAPAATIAPYHYTQIITGSVLGFFLWQEKPKPRFWIGVAIIIFTGICIARSAANGKRPMPADVICSGS